MFTQRKRKKKLPVKAICRNCEAQLGGRYCHCCGQDLFVGAERTVKDLAFNTLENMFVLDNKLFITLKTLILYPGKLTTEYLKGKIVRYVHPSKLFWFISILFFTLSISQVDNFNVKKDNLKQLFSLKNKSDLIELEKTLDEPEKPLGENVSKEKKPPIDFKSYFSTYSPYVAFLLIPFFALLLHIFFYRRDSFYADYLAFALHFHSFVFLLFAIYLGIQAIWSSFQFPKTVFILLPVLYFLRSVWVVYRPKMGAMIWKPFLIICIYGIITVCVIVAFAITVLWIAVH